MRKSTLAILLCAATAACGDRGAEESPEVSAARQEAARRACVSTQLSQQAQDELQTLQQTVDAPGLLTFARAYQNHAQLRQAAYAQLDSALSHSRTPEDSARHARAAEQFRIRAPEPGTLEENVIRDYESDFVAMFNDPDHPCNWQTEPEEAK